VIERLYTALHLSELSLWSVLDILLLAIIIYRLLLLIRGTRSVNILVAIFVLVLFYVLTAPGLIQLSALHNLLGMMLFYIPLAVIVLFQSQIRQALAHLGKNPLAAFLPQRLEDTLIEDVALAAVSLSSKRLGALIIIERDMGLRTFYETGIALDALVSYDLHGAVIIAEGRIKAASCYLPLTTSPSLSRAYGTRHRAGIGITEESDALAVIVSEERGVVSLAESGRISDALDAQSLQRLLHDALAPLIEKKRETGRRADVVATGPSDA
jgi:uncharacterized protein (TIGR00159 family)